MLHRRLLIVDRRKLGFVVLFLNGTLTWGKLQGHFYSVFFLPTFLFIDFVCRLWDIRNMTEVKRVDIPQSATSMVLSKDGSILVVAYAKTISFWDAER